MTHNKEVEDAMRIKKRAVHVPLRYLSKISQAAAAASGDNDGGITPIEEIKAVKTVTGDFGHPERGDTLIRKWNENREYLNPPINVFMPSSTAQQVLVRQALMKGQA
ncbi:unnamed protein product, partial [Notodromas monacha]